MYHPFPESESYTSVIIKSVKLVPPEQAPVESITVKFDEEFTGQPLSVTVITPVVAPLGTSTTNSVAVWLKIVALVPLKSTVEDPVKPVPVIVTILSVGPEVGVKLTMVCVGIQALITSMV